MLVVPIIEIENEEGSKNTGCAYPAHIPRISFGIVCGLGAHPYRCGPRIIENASNSIHFHGLGCALGGAGGPRIIGNTSNFIHFHGLGCALGGAGGPRIISKCIDLDTFPWFGLWFGKRRLPCNHAKCA